MPDNTTTAPEQNAPVTPPPRSYRLTALIVAIALFMEQIDTTVLTTALPTIGREFNAPVTNLSSLITAYLLALAIFIPVSGRLTDRFGAATVFRGAMLMFLIASLLCAWAPSIPLLTAARFIQGMAGAIMIPVGRLVLLRSARKDEIVSAMAWLITPTLLGPILGPAIGGLIVTHLDWRWIFYLNIPIGLVGIVLITLFIDNGRTEPQGRFDLPGFLLTALALSSLLFGFESATRTGEGLQAVILIGLALVTGAIYVAYARGRQNAVLDLSLLYDRSFRLSLAGGSLTRLTQGAQPFLLPLLFQVGMGLSAAASGLIVLSTAIGALAAKVIVAQWLRWVGFRNSLIICGLAASVSYACAGLFRPDWPLTVVVGVLVLSGFFMSLQFSAYNAVAYEHMEPERLTAASSFYSTFQQMLLSIGVCVGALVLHASMVLSGHSEPRPPDFTAAFGVVCFLSTLATFIHVRFPRDAGAVLGGRAPPPAQDSQ